MRIHLRFHHCHTNDNTLTTADFKTLWEELIRQRLVDILFLDAEVSSFQEFMEVIVADNTYIIAGFEEGSGRPAGLFWLAKFHGTAAMIHFTFFRQTVAVSRQLGKAAFREVFLKRNLGGIEVLYGYLPCRYFHSAYKYAMDLGFEDTGMTKEFGKRRRADGSVRLFSSRMITLRIADLEQKLATIPDADVPIEFLF